MAKIEIENCIDCFNTPYIRVSKKRGQLNRREVYEALEKEGKFGHYLIDFNVTDYVPENLYEEGDSWGLYTPEDMMEKVSEEKFNEGYDAARNDLCPEAEWEDRGYGRHLCGNCGGLCPANPFDTPLSGAPAERWHPMICPHCGARMKNGEDLMPFM